MIGSRCRTECPRICAAAKKCNGQHCLRLAICLDCATTVRSAFKAVPREANASQFCIDMWRPYPYESQAKLLATSKISTCFTGNLGAVAPMSFPNSQPLILPSLPDGSTLSRSAACPASTVDAGQPPPHSHPSCGSTSNANCDSVGSVFGGRRSGQSK